MSSGDEGDGHSRDATGASRHMCLRQSGPWKLPKPEDLFLNTDYSRPPPVKEDLVVFKNKKGVSMGHVYRLNNKSKTMPEMYKDLSGMTCKVEMVPNNKKAWRSIEEIFVIDRQFSVGEIVQPFENAYAGTPKARELWMNTEKMLGVITDVKTTVDVLAVPGKKFVLKDIPIEKEPEWAELIGFNLSHNFILYKHWIGDARDCVYEVTLVNRKGERVVVRESGEHEDGVRLLRSASDEMKALIPGEVVQISVHDISSKFARWLVPQNRVPATIKRRRRRRNDDFVHMIVEKIEALEMDIEWLTSPADMLDMPPNRLQKSELEKIVRLETTVNTRLSPSDRFILQTKDEHTFITKTEYLKEVSTKYDGLFKQYKESQPNQTANVDPDAAPGPSPKMQKIDEQEEGEEPMETDEIIDVEAISETDDSSEEEDEEPTTRPKKRTRRTRQTRKAPPKTRLSSERRAKAIFGDKFFAEVLATRSLVTVKWMNGKEEMGIPSCTLVPVDPDIDQQDHLPGTLVCKKEEENPDLKFGIILSANTTERSCQVRWFKRATITSPLEFEKDEEVTLFDIMLHRSYKRTYPGYYGVDTEKNTSELKESAYQVIRDLDNGKQLVRFFDDSLAEKWPDEITQLQFEEMADNQQDDNSLSTDDEFDQDMTAFMNLGSIPIVDEKKLVARDAPAVFCERIYDLLLADTPNSFFEAMALMIIAVPERGDKTRVWEYKPPSMEDLLPDRNGLYYFIEGKHVWNHSHLLVQEAALLLKSMRIAGLKYTQSISPYEVSKHLKNVPPSDREIIDTMLCDSPHVYRCTRFFERDYDYFMDMVCRMVKLAGVHIADKSPPENESCLLFVTPMFEEFTGELNEELNEFLNKQQLERITDKELRYEDNLGRYGFWVKARSPEQARTYSEDGGIGMKPFKEENKKICILSLEEFALLSNFITFLDASYVNGNWLLRGAQRLKYRPMESALSMSVVVTKDAAPFVMKNDLKDGEKISSFCVIRDTAVTPMPACSCDLIGQIISSSNSLATVNTAEYYPTADKNFLTYTTLLQREGIISGPYIDFDEVVKKYMQIAVRREFEGIRYFDLKSLQTALSYVLSPRYFQHRERFNQLVRGGFSYQNIKDNISHMTNRLIHSSKLLEMKEKATGELKTELEKWCKELDLQTKEEASPEKTDGRSKFEMLNEVSEVHNYIKKSSANGREFFKAVRKEHKMLSEHLPDGIYVKAYSDRMDLLTAVIIGPKETPFESVPFVFHLYLPETYPQVPPEVHYVAYSQEQLNPNLYQCGKVCTSLLGTWNGVGNENWNPSSSNLLQVLTSIQGLILVPEPYFNEAGYETRRGQPDMVVHSQRYNETVIINALDYMRRIFLQPPVEWKEIVRTQVQNTWPGLEKLYTSWLEEKAQPPFPVTGSKGFWMALKKAVEKMRDTVQDTENIGEESTKCEENEKKQEKKKETHEDPLRNMYIFISPDLQMPV